MLPGRRRELPEPVRADQSADPRRPGTRSSRRAVRFQDSLAATDAERANPWLLLSATEPDGAIPVIADANSMTYVLHASSATTS